MPGAALTELLQEHVVAAMVEQVVVGFDHEGRIAEMRAEPALPSRDG